MMVGWGEGREAYSSMIKSQFFSEPMFFGNDLHKCFSSCFSSLDETRRLEMPRVEYFPLLPAKLHLNLHLHLNVTAS